MAFNHRKLMIPEPLTVNISVPGNCDYYCDRSKNTEGLCPMKCLSKCYPVCLLALVSQNPPPPDDHVTATPDYGPKFTHSKSPNHLIIPLAVLSAVFAAFLCFAVHRFFKGRRNRPPAPAPAEEDEEEGRGDFLDEDRGPMVDHPIWYIRTIGLPAAAISAITVCRYKRGEGLIEGTECSVCLNEFREDETLRLLPKCSHAFHIPCIDTWLRSHTNCPLCRAGIVSNPARPPSPVPEIPNSTPPAETQTPNPENTSRVTMAERENEEDEGDQEDGLDSDNMDGSNSDENLKLQPVRRSISMDSLSASVISSSVNGRNSDTHLVKPAESGKGIVADRKSIRTMGSSSMKRSFSCGGKVLNSRQSRSRNSNLLHSS